MSLKVLVLHNLESLHTARRSALDHLSAFRRCAPEHEFHFRSITWPVTETLKAQPWDAVIFTSTALGIVTFRPRELFLERKRSWSFLADSPACKIVFPQDDADHGALLDEWFAEMKVDYVFTVRPERKEFIYPRTTKLAAFEQTFAGYLDDDTVAQAAPFRRPFSERTIAIGQRVTLYPAHGGRLGRLKGEAALAVKAAANARNVREDISVDPDNIFTGLDWYRFLGNCRFTVGAEGGLGVWDPQGEVVDRVKAYVAAHPAAHFNEVEAACFPGLDGNPEFPGFSPRILESALMGCCQILVEGEFRGVLKPWIHYIPLARDFSNMSEVFAAMNDETLVARLIAACDADLIASGKFAYERLVSRVVRAIDDHISDARGADRVIAPESPVPALLDRERSIGFRGSALAERVGQFVGAQAEAGAAIGQIESRAVALDLLLREYEAAATAPDGIIVTALRQGAEAAATLRAFASPALPEESLRAATAADAVWAYCAALFDFATGDAPAAVARILAQAQPGVEGQEELTSSLRTAAPALERLYAGGKTADLMAALGHDVPQSLIDLLSMLAPPPAIGGAWYPDDVERLSEARAVVAGAVAGGDTGRMLVALAAAGGRLAGLASRLAPAAGKRFSEADFDRLHRLEKFLRYGPRGDAMLDLLEAGGELPRLVEALAIAGADAAGLITRLLPGAAAYTAEELAWLRRVDRALIPSERPRTETMLSLLEAGGDLTRLTEALAAAGPAVAGIVSRLLPAGERYTAEELAWLERVDRILIRSDRQPERLDALEAHQQRTTE